MQDDVAAIILMGHQLDGAGAQKLEQLLVTEPDNFDGRLRLIGYYYKHYYCCEPAGVRRIDHISWLIRKHPDFNAILNSYLQTHLLDRRGYATIKSTWQFAVSRQVNAEAYCNMAAFVQFQEPDLALELYEKALQAAPANINIIATAQKLRAMKDVLIENRDTITSSADSYFVPGAVTCSQASRVLAR